ncbi:MAG: DUF4249 family protein, partial [Bacteroidota bacterium]
MKKINIVIVAASALLSGCNESFEPKGPFEEQLVVYGFLSTHTDTQYVRLYTTYNTDGFNPLEHTTENQITGASVGLDENGATRQYRDTTITRVDQSRYRSNLHAYVLNPFLPAAGSSYTLNVQSPTGTQARAAVSVPGRGTLSLTGLHVLERPESFPTEDFYLEVRIAAETRGYLLRMFLEISRDGTTELSRIEVPSRIRRFFNSDAYEVVYPKLQRRTSIGGDRGRELVGFQNDAYVTTRRNILRDYGPSNPKLKRAIFVLIQTEPN